MMTFNAILRLLLESLLLYDERSPERGVLLPGSFPLSTGKVCSNQRIGLLMLWSSKSSAVTKNQPPALWNLKQTETVAIRRFIDSFANVYQERRTSNRY